MLLVVLQYSMDKVLYDSLKNNRIQNPFLQDRGRETYLPRTGMSHSQSKQSKREDLWAAAVQIVNEMMYLQGFLVIVITRTRTQCFVLRV